MKRKIIHIIIILIALTLLFVNKYLEIESGTGLFVRVIEPPKLTLQERNWLEKHGNIITYGADQNSPPLRYVDEAGGQYSGFIVDYINALSIEMGVVFDLKPAKSWNEALIQLSNGESDFFDMIPSEERKKVYDFTDTVYLLRGAILVSAAEKTITEYNDLSGKVVAVPEGDYAVEFLNSRVKGIQFVYTENIQDAILKLQEGKVDAVVGDEPVIIYYRQKLQAKDTLKILDNIMYEQGAALAVHKSDKILLSILNKGIRTLEKKDLIYKIQQKWFGISIPSSSEKMLQKITLIVSSLLSLFLLFLYLFYLWNSVLKREVEKRTQELNISRQNLQVTFDGLTHLMIVIDSAYNIQDVNNAFCSMLEIDKKQAIAQNICNFQERILPDNFIELIMNTIIKGKQENEEYNKEGKSLKISTFPLGDKSKAITSVLIMIQDKTQIRLTEQQLLQDRKMAAVGQLAAGVAHEIRNPLGIIRNYCYLLKNSRDEEKIDKSIKVIESSVERASAIINNLLNFSRISCNTREETNIRDFIANTLAWEENFFKTHDIQLDIQCDHELCGYINQESLKHIMTNLSANAVDAMPEGGILIIKCYKEQDNLVIECTDNGIGIKEEHIKDIFNPFFTTKEPGKSIGLGLYITFNEVQKCGGDIRVISIWGEGTTFRIDLPFKGGDNDHETI